MNRDEIRDSVNETVDRARDAATNALHSSRAKLKGELRQAAGRAQDVYGDALQNLESTARERPLPALALALGVGFLIGVVAIRR